MGDSQIKESRRRFENDSGDLQGLVQLKMLGQGYDFPPICVVVPMRPYGCFSEFYQFIGRGIRVLTHPALTGRVGPGEQWLDVIYHAELGLDEHIETIYAENDMDPNTEDLDPEELGGGGEDRELPGTTGTDDAERPETFVLFERGEIEQRVVHDEARMEQRRAEREREALAQRYATYAQSTDDPVSFEKYARSLVASVSDAVESFGRRLVSTDSLDERLKLETSEKRREPFAVADTVLDSLVGEAMAGQQVAKIAAGKVELLIATSSEQQVALSEHFEVAKQEQRGSWYVPESEMLSLGLIHSAHWCGVAARLLVNMAEAERANPEFRGAPEAVAVWVLEPLFEDLFMPFKLRGTKMLGKKDAAQQEAYWKKVEPLYAALGIDPAALTPFAPVVGGFSTESRRSLRSDAP